MQGVSSHGVAAESAAARERYRNYELPSGMTAALAERLERLIYDYQEDLLDLPVAGPVALSIKIFEEIQEIQSEKLQR